MTFFGHNDGEGEAMPMWAPLEPIVVLLRKDHAFHGVDYTGQSVIQLWAPFAGFLFVIKA